MLPYLRCNYLYLGRPRAKWLWIQQQGSTSIHCWVNIYVRFSATENYVSDFRAAKDNDRTLARKSRYFTLQLTAPMPYFPQPHCFLSSSALLLFVLPTLVTLNKLSMAAPCYVTLQKFGRDWNGREFGIHPWALPFVRLKARRLWSREITEAVCPSCLSLLITSHTNILVMTFLMNSRLCTIAI